MFDCRQVPDGCRWRFVVVVGVCGCLLYGVMLLLCGMCWLLLVLFSVGIAVVGVVCWCCGCCVVCWCCGVLRAHCCVVVFVWCVCLCVVA